MYITKLGNVPIGTEFTYILHYSNYQLRITIKGQSKTLDTFSWDSPSCCFNSGNYNQGESGAGSEVRIYSIEVVY